MVSLPAGPVTQTGPGMYGVSQLPVQLDADLLSIPPAIEDLDLEIWVGGVPAAPFQSYVILNGVPVTGIIAGPEVPFIPASQAPVIVWISK